MKIRNELLNRSLRMRRMALASIFEAGSGHPGGVLSSIDLINYILCENSNKNINTKFVLSKGHAAPAIYAAAAENGWINHNILPSLRKLGSPLQGHPSVLETPWAESSTGSLGQGFSFGVGMSMGFRHQKISTKVCVMLGDGELQEGEIWEGAMCASHFKLDNLCAVVDYNKLQSDDLNENIMGLEPLNKKWEAFNWNVIEIDGHDFSQIETAFNNIEDISDKPSVIIAHTIKGKGVSFMEGVPAWHGSVKLSSDELNKSLRDLNTSEEDILSYIDGSIWDRL